MSGAPLFCFHDGRCRVQHRGMSRRIPALAAVFVALSVAAPVATRAAEPVDVALALLGDVSRSVDEAEYALQKQGYTAALTNPDVVAAIRGGKNGAIAIAYLEFASSTETALVVNWTVVRDADTAKAFAARVQEAERSFAGRTAIGSGIERAMAAIRAGGFGPEVRQVIDVCGDGTNNSGRDVSAVRDEAVAAGVVINGLAIINEHPVNWAVAHTQPAGGLPQWYRDHVIGGPGAFVVTVKDFASFGEAMTRKLVDEIAANPAVRAPDRG